MIKYQIHLSFICKNGDLITYIAVVESVGCQIGLARVPIGILVSRREVAMVTVIKIMSLKNTARMLFLKHGAYR